MERVILLCYVILAKASVGLELLGVKHWNSMNLILLNFVRLWQLAE